MLVRKLKDKVKLTGRERIRTTRNHNQWSRCYHQTQVPKSNIVKMDVDQRIDIKNITKTTLKDGKDKNFFNVMFKGTHGHATVVDVDRTNVFKVTVKNKETGKYEMLDCWKVRGTNITHKLNVIEIEKQSFTLVLVGKNDDGSDVYVSGFTFTYYMPIVDLQNQNNLIYLLHPDIKENPGLVNNIVKTLNDINNNIINYDIQDGKLIENYYFQWSDYEPLTEINK